MYAKKRGSKTLNKKAISPLVATVLLVAFTIVLIILVILWGRNFLQERAQKTEQLSQKKLECLDVEITAFNKEVSYSPTGSTTTIKLDIENMGSVDIYKFIFRISNSETQVIEDQGLKAGEVYTYSIATSFSNPDTLDIIPGIKPSGRGAPLIPCSDQHIVVQI